jgi:DNA uptake protein ComE-like DNA-binding protein
MLPATTKVWAARAALVLESDQAVMKKSPRSTTPVENRRASVLLLSLVVVVLLTLGAMSFFERMFVEHQATRAHIRQTQARYFAESGVEFIRALAVQDPALLQQSGGLYSNPALMQGKLMVDDPLAAFRGRFTVIAPAVSEAGLYAGIRYGLENESARLNLNTVLLADNYGEGGAQKLLMTLPGMTEPIADAILDWIDTDSDQRTLGAEQDYYSALSPPYAPRNGPLGSIEELLLVRDVTPAMLFGADLNRNALIEANEQPYTVIEGVDNTTGQLNRGWAAYLTLDSAESNLRADGTPKLDINMQDLQELHTQASQILGAPMANFIVAYRQGGPEEEPEEGAAPTGRTVESGSLQPDFTLPGRERLNNLLDLVGARTSIVESSASGGGGNGGGGNEGGGGNNGGGNGGGGGGGGGNNQEEPPKCDSPFREDSSSMRDYIPKLFDNFSVNASPSIPGRININQAPRAILLGIPGIDIATVDQIIANRMPEDDGQRPEQAYETWPLVSGLVDLDTMKQLMPLVTAGGDVYRAQVVGYFDEEGPAYRTEVVVDATQTPPVVKRRRDLVDQGPGYTLETLGVTVEDVP